MRASRWLLGAGSLILFITASVFTAEPAAVSMSTAANALLASLSPEQRQKAQFSFDADERTHWHFIPTAAPPAGFPRNGLTIKEMQPAQRALAHALLKTGLSQHGYLTATQIMELETTLAAIERAARASGGSAFAFERDPERYFVSVFGTPSARGTWGWRFEGHHVSLQFTIVEGSTNVSSPTFFGSNPAQVREGPKKGLRVLGFEEDPARALLAALSPEQRSRAILPGDAPRDIVTMNRYPIEPLAPAGITAAALDAKQRQLLLSVIEAYTGQMAADIAAARTERFRKAGIEQIGFVWAGGTAPGEKHYYRVQGPTFLIEYDNTQNDGNHVHSVWRDFTGDFGRDLLREHLLDAH